MSRHGRPAGASTPAVTSRPIPALAPCGRRARGGPDSGYSTVEAVLLLPVLITLTLIVVQFALVWNARAVAESAARRGADAARAYTATDADGRAQARTYLTQVAPTLVRSAHIDVTRTPTTVAVRIRAQVLSVAGLPFTMHVDARASGPIERFVAPEEIP